ncbi:MAG: 3'-5' exoribonuclease [Nitrosomonas sp.]|nr:3'-5' exoribonuclease [Moraxellaceae bacterium]MDP1952034.1 3'-5' exoribonuclease [Nitrosomonas sp.]
MNVFFDTEFSDLIGIKHDPALISVGCVASDGREYYAELSNTWTKEICSDFVIGVVIPLLQGDQCRMTEAQLAVSLKDWIEGLTEQEVIFRSDSPSFDWGWIVQLFQDYGWPKNLRKKCGTIYFNHDYQIRRYEQGLAEYWKANGRQRHHALVDARSLQFAWKFAIKRGM